MSQLLDDSIPGEYELIVVDDDSTHTWECSTISHRRIPPTAGRRQQERGLSSAVIRGWQVARGSILGVIDGDLQHPPEVLTQLLREMMQRADADW